MKWLLAVWISLFSVNAQSTEFHEAWNAYAERFIQDDGRVIDRDAKDRTTSESQIYALFHAYIADDRQHFATLLAWLQNNLTPGGLDKGLPAWLWGEKEDKSWGVVDPNNASDVDLLLAYILLHAGKQWNQPEYYRLGDKTLNHLSATSVRYLDGLGLSLIPGAEGFVNQGSHWKLNPSYLALPVIKGLCSLRPDGPWCQLWQSSLKILRQSSVGGYSPDWVQYAAERGFVADADTQDLASYDAIRVYMWLGMLHEQDSQRLRVLNALNGPLQLCHADQWMPEKIWIRADKQEGPMPLAYAGVMAVYYASFSEQECADKYWQHILAAKKAGLYGEPPRYYDQNLILFALAWRDELLRFSPSGELLYPHTPKG